MVLVIDHTFKSAEDVYICLSVPFSYSENEQYLQRIKMNVHPCIEYKDEVLAVTPQKRIVHLLTVSEKAKRGKKSEERKPVVMVTARVHPGEVSSSFCFQGVLEFLLNYNNMQAYLLRKLFVFKMVPMLNPDGVCEGNYRMDPQGFNLNRFYNEPSPESQYLCIYSVRPYTRWRS
jgi:murein tripeptide amidase MpaA